MDIKEILRLGSTAPSGDNCQPWQVQVSGNTLAVFNRPERDLSLYNSKQRASLIAIGAFIENIKIASARFGLKANINYFLDKNNENHIADIELEDFDDKLDSDLFSFLEKRHTNRKPYSSKPLQTEQKSELMNSAKNDFGIKLSLTDDEMSKNKIAISAGMNEFLVLTIKRLHTFLFDHIRWNSKQVNQTKNGFDLKTLEMDGLQKAVFRLASNWRIMQIFQKIRLPIFIAKENSKIYVQSQAFGVLIGSDDESETWLNCGRVLQRVWLTATRLGLSVHPLTGIIFLNSIINDGSEELSSEQKTIVDENYKQIFKAFNLQAGRMLFLFRIGSGSEPSAVSNRFEIKEFTNL